LRFSSVKKNIISAAALTAILALLLSSCLFEDGGPKSDETSVSDIITETGPELFPSADQTTDDEEQTTADETTGSVSDAVSSVDDTSADVTEDAGTCDESSEEVSTEPDVTSGDPEDAMPPDETSEAPEETPTPETTEEGVSETVETTGNPDVTLPPDETSETPEETTALETSDDAGSEPGETTSSEPNAWIVAPPEGAETVGYTARGYAIQIKDGLYYVGGILVANKSYPVPSDYVPEGYPVPMVNVIENRLLPEAQEKFTEMQQAFFVDHPSNKGFRIQYGYRSYITQANLYDNYKKAGGFEYAETIAARPGHSEHQLGLAADVNVNGVVTLNETFKNTVEGKWLAANSWKYGFILRYPEGKTSATGYVFEPWHFRYVGVEAAAMICESGLSLEEFLGIDSVYHD